MAADYSNKKLKRASFQNKELSYTTFSGSDLRGADFSGANLSGVDFRQVKTGIPPAMTVLLFLAALVVSLFSGYIAMLAGHTVQQMLTSPDNKIRISGFTTIVLNVLFIAYAWRNGGGSAIRNLFLPAVGLAAVIGFMAKFSGLGTGMGMLYQILALLLLVVMFVVGTIARAAAGTLSSTIIFLIVAVGGSLFGKSVGGGIGTTIMALSCAQISKRALSGAKGFESLQKVAHFITARFGTSFRNARLTDSNFTGSKIRNTDFSNADISNVNWGDSNKKNCIINEYRPVVTQDYESE